MLPRVHHWLIICIFILLSNFSNAQSQTSNPFWIDVRTADEYAAAHVQTALNIPYEHILTGLSRQNISKEETIYLYCRSGRRAGIAMEVMHNAGYKNVVNLKTLENAQEKYKAFSKQTL